MNAADITVTVRKSSTRWPIKRPQRWYWTATAANNHILAQSEMYTNQMDAWKAACHLFGTDVTVTIRMTGQSSITLRQPEQP